MVQVFSLKAADPGFDVTIGYGRLVGRLDNATILTTKILVESLGELTVTIMEQEPHVDPFLLSPHAQVSGLLPHPLTIRIVGTG